MIIGERGAGDQEGAQVSDTIMGLLNPAIAAIFALIFFGLWLRDRSAMHVLALAGSYTALSTGFAIFHFVDNPDSVLAIVGVHLIYSMGAFFLCWAAARRVNQRIPIMTFVAILTVALVVIIVGSYGANMNVRLVAVNSAYGLIIALTTQLLVRSGERQIFDRAVIWLFAITSAQFFVRPLLAMIMSGPMTGNSYRESDIYAIWMLTMGVVSLLLALTLVAAVIFDQWRAERISAERDHLTGLKMRRAFENEAMGLLDENGDRRIPVSMIVADIDHFKAVNDTFGHLAGDEAIAAFGRLIGKTVRDSDICGRVGGEEFCILVWNCDLGPAYRLAERLRRAFGDTQFEALGEDVRLTASFGVAQWREGEGYGKLFARADKALYDAKESGRNKVATERLSASVTEIGDESTVVGRKKLGSVA